MASIQRMVLSAVLCTSAIDWSTSTVYAQAGALEEVLVVARKREEMPQDVPLSMTVISAQKIGQLTATGLKDLMGNVPNASLDITGNSLASWGMRGIVSQTRNAGQESGLGIYVDGAYLGRPAGFNIPLNDIAQVEVLRGPQGSLFGRNTIAGAIAVTTKRPSEEFSGYLQGSFGNLDRQDIQAGISGPIVSDTLAGKINLFSFERDGYVDNIMNGDELQSDDRQGGRGALYWTPNSALELVLSADYMEQDNTLMAGQTVEPQLNNFIPGWYLPGNDKVNQNDPGYDRIDTGGVGLRMDWEIAPELTFTSITSSRFTDFETLVDDDAGPITLTWSNFFDDSDTFTQEFLLRGNSGEQLDYVVGFYYLDMEVSSDRTTGLNTPYPVHVQAITSDSQVDTEAWAVFGSLDYSLTESMDITLGLRYTDEDKDSHFVQTENGGLGFPNVTFDTDISDSAWSGDISLTWFATEETNIYASVRRGFKSGGFQTDIINFASEDLYAFGPEEALSYELGLKGVYLDGSLSLDLAMFRTDYEDIQVGQLVGLGFTTTNAAESEINGLELQLNYRPTERWRLGLNLGLLDHEYTEFDNCTTPGSTCAGNDMQWAPDATWSADIGYNWPLAGGANIDFFLSANYRDSYFTTAVNDPQLEIDERTLLDGRIAWTSAGDGLTVALWGRNLADEEWELTRWQYPVTALAFGGFDPTITGGQRTPAEPRTYGIELTLRF